MSTQSPPHLHNAVHFNEIFLHLHRPLHPLSLLHPQRMSSWHTTDACGIVIQEIVKRPFSSDSQPHWFGSGRFCWITSDWLQQYPAWYTARLVCCKSASEVEFPLMSGLSLQTNLFYIRWRRILCLCGHTEVKQTFQSMEKLCHTQRLKDSLKVLESLLWLPIGSKYSMPLFFLCQKRRIPGRTQ